MKKFVKLLSAILAVIMAFSCAQTAYCETPEMTIYSIGLGVGNNGDATLVCSEGNYLLMDVGVREAFPAVEKFLDEQPIERLSIYLSHFHGDHTGGFDNADGTPPLCTLISKYPIDNIYLPDPVLLKYKGETIVETEGVYYRKIREYFEQSEVQDKEYDDVLVYLNETENPDEGVKNHFTLGSVEAEVIGPVYTDTYTSPSKNLDDYQNNCSLVTKMTCGNISFLTAGDLKTDGENALIKKYKGTDKLKSTIFKMSHHGMYPANSNEFVDCVRPDFTFVSNYSATGVGSSGKFWSINTAAVSCKRYGFVYMGGDENKTLCINVNNNAVSLNRYKETTQLNAPGWSKVVGGDGVNRKYDYYYFSKNGYTLKGVQKIDGKYYYLGTGGFRHYASIMDGAYHGMTLCTEDGKKRYFDSTKNSAGETSDEMYVGFYDLKDKQYAGLHYFEKDGNLKVATNGGWQKVKIGDYYYSLYKSGLISTNVFREFGSAFCYFDNKGRMATGWKTVNDARYYFDKTTGGRVTGLQKIDGYYYFFSDYGKLVKNAKRTINNRQYTFGKDGKMTNVPKVSRAEIVSLKSKKTSITVNRKKQSADGWVVYISEKKDSGYKKVATVKKGSSVSTVVDKLKKNKTYYIKIRNYKKVGSYTEYGKYSKVKSIKTKK